MLSSYNPGLSKIRENFRKFSKFDIAMTSEAVYLNAQYHATLTAILEGATLDDVRGELIKAQVCHQQIFFQLLADTTEGLKSFKDNFIKELQPKDIQSRLKDLQEELERHVRNDQTRIMAKNPTSQEIVWTEKITALQLQKYHLEALLVNKIISGAGEKNLIESLPLGTYCRLGEESKWNPSLFPSESLPKIAEPAREPHITTLLRKTILST
ncbi:MAG: hypothetical protein ACYCQI_06945 [Gammaproteobacteria bacterium]